MARKKKQKSSLIILVLVLVVLIVAYVIYDIYEKGQAKKKATRENGAIELMAFDLDEIKSIHYEYNDEAITLVRNEEKNWCNQDEMETPLNLSYTKPMENVLKQITATKLVNENALDLSEYGLDHPKIKIIITKTDNEVVCINLGDKSPSKGEYYMSINDEQKVYFVGDSLYNAYKHPAKTLVQVATAPSITVANITHVLVDKRDTSNLEIVKEDNNVYDRSNKNTAPYYLKQGYENPVSGDKDNITAYLGKYAGLNYSECMEYNCTDFSKYGLSDPIATITVDYFEEAAEGTNANTDEDKEAEQNRNNKTYQLLIGDLDQEHYVYYVKEQFSNSVYTLGQSAVESMINFDLFSLTNKSVQLVNIESVESVDIAITGKDTHSFKIERTKKTEDGNDFISERYTLDGKEYDSAKARGLYEAIIGPVFDTPIPEGYHDIEQVPDITFTFKCSAESGEEDLVVEYRSYDSNFYTATVNGVEHSLVDKRVVDDIIGLYEYSIIGL